MRAIALVLIAGLLVTCSARAATVTVSWANPTTNVDGSALTNLDHLTIWYGRCGTVNPPTLDAVAGSVTATPAQSSGVQVTVNLPAPLCFFLTATTTAGLSSAESAVVEWTPIGTLGKPTTLGQPITLPP